ncbi:translation initiation factor IF-2-like [Panthera tigris]|uniref:translation initiation factor IF-2-like n=1 Tax=Panthera tigris TaxID=9694 RepID=UPI001C6FBF55|nr:translation initiation factor IF-2-like [Panthera tigris]
MSRPHGRLTGKLQMCFIFPEQKMSGEMSLCCQLVRSPRPSSRLETAGPKDGLVKKRFCPEAFSAGITPAPQLPRPPARPVRAAPSSLTTPTPGRAQRSHRRPEPGDLTSGRSRRQRTPSWGSAHPGVTGSRKVRPREARNELCNRQGPQARTEAAARGTSASRARPATQAGSPLATGPHVGAPPPGAAAARSRRRHLRSWQPSREARRPAQAQTSRIPTAMETEALRG